MFIRQEIDTIENINIKPTPVDSRMTLLLSRRDNLTLPDEVKDLDYIMVNIDPNRS
jgi:hypothetical protein